MGSKIVKYHLLLSIISLTSTVVLLCGTSTKNIVATRATNAPTIDGMLNEEVWHSAIPVSGFQQYEPDEGANATEPTTVSILYDDNALYIGVMCYDSDPKGIVSQLSRRDRTLQSDRISIMIDSYHCYQTAFLFSGTVSNVQADGILSNDGLVYDVQWDAVWDFKSAINDEGWSAEFKIPYSALRFSDQDSEYVWGINFRRYIARKKETDEWVMVPRKDAPPGTISSVSKMGNLSGITDIHPSLHLELLPYHVSKISFLTRPSPFTLQKKYSPDFGIDLKYGLTNNFTFDLAINPDFGQVEVDQAKLNLTIFETFYPEKRPFFLEGSQIFSFGNCFDTRSMMLLYSRRIGKQPSAYDALRTLGNFDLWSNAAFYEKPTSTTILSAAKISGQTSNGLEVGILSTITDKEYATLEDTAGNRSPKILVEPLASYNVVRLKQNTQNGSTFASFGIMSTNVSKHKNRPAFSNGIDWSVRFDDNVYGFDGYLVTSSTTNLDRQILYGNAGKFGLAKLRGEHWLVFSAYDFSSRNYNIDDLGYYSQPREHGGYLQLSYKEDRAEVPIWRYVVSAQVESRWDWNSINTKKRFELEPIFEFRNFWRINLDYIREFSAYDDENQGIIGFYKRPAGNLFSTTIQTDPRKQINFLYNIGYQKYVNKSNTILSIVQATIRPISWMEYVPSFTFMKTKKEEAWLIGYYVDGHNLFGDRDVNYYDFSLKGIITFTPKLSVQFFNQILLAKYRYVNYKSLISPDNLSPIDYNGGKPIDYFLKVFNANIVFRWEYLPGSTLYLVWTQGRQGYQGLYDQKFSKDLQEIFHLPMDNIILMKVTYWWSL